MIITESHGYGYLPYGVPPFGQPAGSGAMGWQAQFMRNSDATAWQAQIVNPSAFGFQARVTLYNTNRIRVLYEFPSRGAEDVSGNNNAWGNPEGTGQNWSASSTQASDTSSYDVSNLNTDIVEEVWRSATGVKTGITLSCDTEVTQGVFVDTFAILNTNISSSATVNLVYSNVSNFAVSGSIALSRVVNGNIVYIAPTLPLTPYKYWRIEINDPTNSANHIYIGSVVFGSALIFHQECIVDKVELEPVHYKDFVFTEAHTNVANDRGIKNVVALEFRNLDYSLPNYNNVKQMFDVIRRHHKALWIPVPELPHRYLCFGKINKLPREVHNVKGEDNDYVSFPVEIDEAL